MKYVLGLSLCFRAYKNKQALLRIFSDDKLIDEITFTTDIKFRTFTENESIAGKNFYDKSNNQKINSYRNYQDKLIKNIKTNLETYKQKHRINRDNKELEVSDIIPEQNLPSTRKRTYELPEKLFLYEVDDENIGTKITIECINHNNNSTNGFMTQTSYYQFYDLFMIPKYFFEDGSLKEIITRLWKNGYCETITIGDVQTNNTWPGAQKVRYRGTAFSDLGQKQSLGSIWHVPLGGHFYLDIDVIKKHKILLLSDKKNTKGRYLINYTSMLTILYFDLLNKLKYEDQRSHITKD